MSKKTFVLDTNILLHDPTTLTNFTDNDVIVPLITIEELDNFKREMNELGRNSREVQRQLDVLFPTTASTKEGYNKPQGGTVKVIIYDPTKDDVLRQAGLDISKPDNLILAVALQTQKENQAKAVNGGELSQTIVVSKDANVRLKARFLGLEAEDLKRDKVDEDDVKLLAYPDLVISESHIQRLFSTGTMEITPHDVPEESMSALSKLEVGYVTLTKIEHPDQHIPAKYLGHGLFRRLEGPSHVNIQGGQTLRALNLEQKFLIDALFDPSVSLVTVNGVAGTGKSLVAIAAALSQVQNGVFDKLLISRPVIAMGNDIGFLPGSVEEKMKPWVQPAYDAVEYLLSKPKPEQFQDKPQSNRKNKQGQGKEQAKGHGKQQNKGPKQDAPMKPHERLMQSGIIEIEVLAHIRGRSIPRAIFVADEMQNTSPLEVKTLITRMSQGSKLILIGDPDQIDKPYTDKLSNGLVYAQSRMKGTPVHVHVNLFKGERSQLAELAAQRM